MKTKRAFITGITGQDGSYLAEFLLNKKYEVHGLTRRASNHNTRNIEKIRNRIILHYGDLLDNFSIWSIINTLKPDEIYNLGSPSQATISFDTPDYSSDAIAFGVLRILEAIRLFSPNSKLFQASTSELFGNAPPPQNEETVMHPNSPYGVAKLFAHEMTRVYREYHNIFACCGILFNHESPRRGEEFVTMKIVKGLVNIKKAKQEKLYLGNLYSKRDWGYAGDYVEAMWLMLQQKKPEDFVIGTGLAHSIEDFLNVAANYIQIEWAKYVEVAPTLYRPTDTDLLLADPTKARLKLKWKPRTKFEELVRIMVAEELRSQD